MGDAEGKGLLRSTGSLQLQPPPSLGVSVAQASDHRATGKRAPERLFVRQHVSEGLSSLPGAPDPRLDLTDPTSGPGLARARDRQRPALAEARVFGRPQRQRGAQGPHHWTQGS